MSPAASTRYPQAPCGACSNTSSPRCVRCSLNCSPGRDPRSRLASVCLRTSSGSRRKSLPSAREDRRRRERRPGHCCDALACQSSRPRARCSTLQGRVNGRWRGDPSVITLIGTRGAATTKAPRAFVGGVRSQRHWRAPLRATAGFKLEDGETAQTFEIAPTAARKLPKGMIGRVRQGAKSNG